MKKLAPLLLIFLTTSCTVSKPVILNASYKQLNQVRKAYTQTSTRNGLTDIEFARTAQRRFNINDNERITFSFEIYVTPFTNQTAINYFANEQSFGSYKSYTSSLPFQTKASIQFQYRNDLNNTTELYTETQTMLTNTNVRNHQVFNMYHLPYNLDDWGAQGRVINSFIYKNTLSCLYNDNFEIAINPEEYIQETYRNIIYNGQIYYNFTASKNIADELPQGLQDLYYNDFATLDAVRLYPIYNINNGNYPNLQNNQSILQTAVQSAVGTINVNEKINYSYRYNAAFTEELSAYMDGYNLGIEEGTSGVGTTRVQQVFRAIQSFLNIDFGFFKLAHVLGGMLVIAIVIFIVRWFR